VKIRLGAGGCGLGSLTGAKADERQVLLPILDDTGLAALLPGQTLIGDKSYYGRHFEAALSQAVLHTSCARRARVSPQGPARSSSGRLFRVALGEHVGVAVGGHDGRRERPRRRAGGAWWCPGCRGGGPVVAVSRWRG